MTTLAIHRLRDGVLTSADTATLTITTSVGTPVLLGAVVVPTSAGVYSYATTPLVAGTYTASWTFIVSGLPDETVTRTFQVETPVSTLRGITLAEIERGLAARIGPYHRYKASSGSTTAGLAVARLKSNTDSGDYEDQYLLRRGRSSSEALIANFPDDDRIRLIASFDPALGVLSPDRNWSMAPQVDEWVELHYLDPDDLREAAIQGLRRCYFWDTVEISTTTYLREIDLTESAWWVTDQSQIRAVSYGRLSFIPSRAPWFGAFQQGNRVFLQNTIPNVGTVRIQALRSHDTFVNGEDSYVGPNHDDDLLNVDREYALRAGHIAAWMLFPARLSPVAAQGLALPMKQVADVFTISSLKIAKNGPPEVLQNRFEQDGFLDTLQVGNISADVT